MKFGLVIPTYNRLEVLKKCLAKWADCRPGFDQLVVVDASEDGEANKRVVLAMFPDLFRGTSQYLTGMKPSIAGQRNLGLASCDTDVVAFPDDDAFPHTDYIGKVMAVFEADTEQVIAGVQGTSTIDPGSRPQVAEAFGEGQAKEMDKWNALTSRGFFDPKDFPGFWIPRPHALADMALQPTLFLYGWGMNYRRHVIDEYRFDEKMERWCLDDIEVGIRIAEKHLQVVRKDALIDHRRISKGVFCVKRQIGMVAHFCYILAKNNLSALTRQRYRDYLAESRRLDLMTQDPLLRGFWQLADVIASRMLDGSRDQMLNVYEGVQNFLATHDRVDTPFYLTTWLENQNWYQSPGKEGDRLSNARMLSQDMLQ